MKYFIYITILMIFTGCADNKTGTPPETDSSAAATEARKTYKIIPKDIIFPTEAVLMHNLPEDTLVATMDNSKIIITPEGKIYWENTPADSIRLQTDVLVERAFLHQKDNTLYVFYTETDGEGAGSIFEKFDLASKKRLMKTDIPGFNLGIPYITGKYAYVTTIGTVGKLDLTTGKYAYQHRELYDSKKYSFNSFDTIVFTDEEAIFISENINSGRKDSLIVNEKTGRHTVIK